MCAMFGKQKEADNREEDQHYNSSAGSKPRALSCVLIVIHKSSELSPFMTSALAIGSNNLFANFTNTDAPSLKVVSHQCFTDADAAVFPMLGFKAAM